MNNVTHLLSWLFRKACTFEVWVPAIAAKQRSHPWNLKNHWATKYKRHQQHYNALRAARDQARKNNLFLHRRW